MGTPVSKENEFLSSLCPHFLINDDADANFVDDIDDDVYNDVEDDVDDDVDDDVHLPSFTKTSTGTVMSLFCSLCTDSAISSSDL